MRLLRILVAAALGALSMVIVGAGPAFACSCVMADTATHVGQAEVVVAGTVVETVPPRQKHVMSSMDPVTYVVDIDEAFKGDTGPVVEVLSASSGASCGLENVEVGERYVVFASHESMEGQAADQLWANLCGGTDRATPKLVAAVEEVTGGGVVPVSGGGAGYDSDLTVTLDPSRDPDGPGGSGWALPLGLVAGALLALLTGSLWVRQRFV